ncbi:MAG: HlyD family efflux transporter periplasmic adaptor subunit [Eubacteriales bacterium]
MDKKYLRGAAVYFALALMSVLVIVYILYAAFGGRADEVETIIASLVTERDTVTLDAYIMREEKILYSSEDGSVSYLSSSGSKVGVTTEVANIYAGTDSDENREQIIGLDSKISILSASNIASNIVLSDTTQIDTRIAGTYSEITYSMASGDIGYALRRRDELLTLINKRRIITRSVADYNDRITTLTGERAALSGLGAEIAETVKAGISGYFYSDIDGYENVFTSAKASDMTIADFDSMKEAPPADFDFVSGKGYGIGKIVTDYNWYIVCEADADALRTFRDGNKYTVIFPYSADCEIAMTLYRVISDAESGRVVLIFKTGVNPDGFNYLRRQTVEVVRSAYTGYRVPISSVRILGDRQGVYILDGNIVQFRDVLPLCESNGYFIVEVQPDSAENEQAYLRLGLYDLVITKGTNLYEGKIIE